MNWRAASGTRRAGLEMFRFADISCALLAARCSLATKPMLDLKITNARIVDGTGAPWFRGDVGVRGDTIVAIGDLSSTASMSTLDAHDNVVAPGFIDLLGQSQYSVLRDPHVEAKVRQGVTTEVTGEGHSPGPVSPAVKDSEAPPNERAPWTTLGQYFATLEKN